jgi:hypothetical protein
MSRHEARYFAKDTSKKLFGAEETIVMGVQDARYRYYQWLRSWYGMGEKAVTHKCPFYQFMFWGTLIMVTTFPLFVLAYLIYGITKVIGLAAPSVPENFERLKNENPFVFSIMISLLIGAIIFFTSILFFSNGLAWLGFVVHCIFAAPLYILILLWLLISWLGGVLGIFFVWIWSLLVAVNWGLLGYVAGMGLLYLVAFFGSLWLLYRLGVFLFNRGCFNFLIKKSCNYRENRRAKINARIAERQERERLARLERDKYYKEHKEEIDAKNLKREQGFEKWADTISKIFKPLIFVLEKVLMVIAYFFIGIWWVIKKVGEIFYVLWHMITSTVSNHCPPIEFIQAYEDKGELINDLYNGFTLTGEKKRKLFIEEKLLPKGFKVRTGKEDYKKVRINYNLTTISITDYDERYHVHSINSIKYLPKPRQPRVKKTNTDEK